MYKSKIFKSYIANIELVDFLNNNDIKKDQIICINSSDIKHQCILLVWNDEKEYPTEERLNANINKMLESLDRLKKQF